MMKTKQMLKIIKMFKMITQRFLFGSLLSYAANTISPISFEQYVVIIPYLFRYSLRDKQLALDATTCLYGICWLTDIDWTNRCMSMHKISKQVEGTWL